MAQNRQRFTQRKQNANRPRPAYATPVEVPPPPPPPTSFGESFIVMEDSAKNTFIYNGTGWVPHTMSIAECRRNSCQVKELPQKLNDKTRYEIREPLA